MYTDVTQLGTGLLSEWEPVRARCEMSKFISFTCIVRIKNKATKYGIVLRVYHSFLPLFYHVAFDYDGTFISRVFLFSLISRRLGAQRSDARASYCASPLRFMTARLGIGVVLLPPSQVGILHSETDFYS